VGLGNCGKTLTALTGRSVQDESYQKEEEKDEEELTQRWAPRFHRRDRCRRSSIPDIGQGSDDRCHPTLSRWSSAIPDAYLATARIVSVGDVPRSEIAAERPIPRIRLAMISAPCMALCSARMTVGGLLTYEGHRAVGPRVRSSAKISQSRGLSGILRGKRIASDFRPRGQVRVARRAARLDVVAPLSSVSGLDPRIRDDLWCAYRHSRNAFRGRTTPESQGRS